MNAAIEARQRSDPIDAPGATAPRPSTSSSDLDPGLGTPPAQRRPHARDRAARIGRTIAAERGGGQRVVRGAYAAARAIGWAPAIALGGLACARAICQRGTPPTPSRAGRRPGSKAGEARKRKCRSSAVDARRHAGAVDRLLRALRGETNAG